MRRWWSLVLLVVVAGIAWVLGQDAVPFASGWLARPQRVPCDVEGVLDGDSLRVRCADGPVEVRLHCIDAPERDQVPWAKRSRRHLAELASRRVELVAVEHDRFGRLVAEVYGTGPQGLLLNLEQVRGGHAAVYRRYCKDSRYERAEQQAKEAGRGIWSRPGSQQRPWQHRHGG
ncbi:MAG: thermonuclease family protein [Bdellovibrio bacteriovorus]